MEAHLLEDNLAVRRLWQTDGFRWRRDLRSLVEKLRDALGGAGGKLHFAPHLRDLTERARGEDGIEHELAQSPARQVPGNDLLGAVPQDADDRSERQEDNRGGKPGASARALDGGVEGISSRRFEQAPRMLLLDEGLDRRHCGKTLLGMEFLIRGATVFGEPGVCLSFEETLEELSENVASLGFDLNDLIRKKKLITTREILKIQECLIGHNAGIRTQPGTALKSARTGKVSYTPPVGKSVRQQR